MVSMQCRERSEAHAERGTKSEVVGAMPMSATGSSRWVTSRCRRKNVTIAEVVTCGDLSTGIHARSVLCGQAGQSSCGESGKRESGSEIGAVLAGQFGQPFELVMIDGSVTGDPCEAQQHQNGVQNAVSSASMMWRVRV